MVKKAPARNRAGNPDFTFKDLNRAGIRFNSKAFIEIEYEADTEDVTITKTDEIGETVKTIVSNFDSPGGSVLGTKTITENGTYNASADELDGYSSVTVNVPAAGYTIDDVAEKNFTGNITLNTATIIKSGAFAESEIVNITGDAPLKIEGDAFRRCNYLLSVDFPNVAAINLANYALANCPNLETVKFPKLSNLSSTTYLFANCPKLKFADLGVIPSLINYMFQNNTDLRTMILRKTDSICTTSWANANVFGGIYDNPEESTIYVPSNLISTYEQATNWSVLYTMGVTFAAIEGSAYE